MAVQAPQTRPSDLWTQHFAARTRTLRSSIIRDILRMTEQPEVISFAGGLPNPELFPKDALAEASHKVLTEAGKRALQYSMTAGLPELRTWIADWMRAQGSDVNPDNIMITSGSQQALDLLAKVLIDPGKNILVENPTYLGTLQAWTIFEAAYTTLPTDDDGVLPEAVSDHLKGGPALAYLQPNFQNPTGATLPLARREALATLAEERGLCIIEDDPYGQLVYDEAPPASLRSLHDSVIYISSFSKVLAPGLRLAWLTAPQAVIQKLQLAKQGTDLHTSTTAQLVVLELLKNNFLDTHVPRLQAAYKSCRDLMLAEMKHHFPEAARWDIPKGGMFIWVRLPTQVDALKVLEEAVTHNVAFVPGGTFFPNGGGDNTLRLNFTNASDANIREGIARLGRVLHQWC
jgi:2-aminoadipate transaminase